MAIWLATLTSRTKIVIDFHNYGFTILRLNIKNKLVLGVAQAYEKYFSRKAHRFLCVSDKMQEDLRDNWDIPAVTLYDRPLQRSYRKEQQEGLLEKYGQAQRKED